MKGLRWLLVRRVSLPVPSILTRLCMWGLVSITTPVLSNQIPPLCLFLILGPMYSSALRVDSGQKSNSRLRNSLRQPSKAIASSERRIWEGKGSRPGLAALAGELLGKLRGNEPT